MKDFNGLEQAKQGQPDAIAALMNHQLKSKGIQVQARRRDDRLQMRFKSSKVPQEGQLTPWVHRGLERLHPAGIQQVQIEGWKHGASRPAWIKTFTLTPPAAPTSPLPEEMPGFEPVAGERAEEGDSGAIASALQPRLEPHHLTVQVRVRDRVLILTIAGKSAPTPSRLKTLLQPYLESQSDGEFDRIHIESKAETEDFLAWSQDWQEVVQSKPSRSKPFGLKFILIVIGSIFGLLILGLILLAIFVV